MGIRITAERASELITRNSPVNIPSSPSRVDVGTAAQQPGTGNVQNTPTYAFEQVAAILTPFDLKNLPLADETPLGGPGDAADAEAVAQYQRNRQEAVDRLTTQPLFPIFQTNGLVFPYNPTINEGINVKYDTFELTHTNESYYAYRGTDNVRINLTDCVWTCDTFDNAIYTMSVLHFMRAYSFMDFGNFRTGRPPSPMWFSAYGNYAFYKVPVLLEKADWSFPNDIDYIGIPEFGSSEYLERRLQTKRNASGNYTWLPMKFTISSISLIVQHSPRYWTNWSLDDYRSGEMLKKDGKSFHVTQSRRTV